MKIHSTARHCEISQQERDYIADKMENGLKMFPDVVRDVQVTVTQENYLYDVEAVIKLTRNKTITAEAQDKDIRTAVDAMQSKASTQLRRFKDKIDDYHKQGRPPRRVPVE